MSLKPPGQPPSAKSSSSDLTIRDSPYTAAQSPHEMEKMMKATKAMSPEDQHAKNISDAVQGMIRPAKGRDLAILRQVLIRAARSYMEWKIEAGTGDPDQALKNHQKAWKAMLNELNAKDVVRRYKDANEGDEGASFKTYEGLAGKIYQDVSEPWDTFVTQTQNKESADQKGKKPKKPKRTGPRLPHAELGEFSANNEKLWKRFDEIANQHLSVWKLQIMPAPKKKGSWKGSSSTPKTTNQALA